MGGEDFVPTELEIPPQYTGGTLEITPPTLYVPPGEKLITRVTVDTGDGEVVSESVFAPPAFDQGGITLSMVGDVCVITASVLPEGAEPMSNCAAKLTMYNAADEPIYTKDSIALYKDSSSDSYSGTCTVSTEQELSYIEVKVTGAYFKKGKEIYSDLATAVFSTF